MTEGQKPTVSWQDTLAVLGILAILGTLFGFMLWEFLGPLFASRPQEQRQAGWLTDEVQVRCIGNVTNKLRSPSSAMFRDESKPSFNGTAWTWQSYVDAKNAFGVELRVPFACEVTGTPEAPRVLTLLNE